MSRLLVIEIDSEMADWPEIVELREKGHTIITRTSNADLVLSRVGWRVDDVSRKYIPISVKESRKEKYGNVSNPKVGTKTSNRPRPRKAAKVKPSADNRDASGPEVLRD